MRRSRRKRRRGGEEGEGGGEGGDGEEDGEELQKVCSVITLSSSPYWCLLPILGRIKEPQSPSFNVFISGIFFLDSQTHLHISAKENLKVYWVQGLRPSILAVTSTCETNSCRAKVSDCNNLRFQQFEIATI